jgi:gliding motility-associated-like protein
MASGGSGIYTYAWTSVPAGFTSSIADPTANQLVNTTYYVAVSDGSANVNSQVAVTVNALPAAPTITAGGPTTFCANGNVTLTSSAGTSYLWSNGANTASINVTTAGSYTVKVKNAGGCLSSASAAKVVTVNALPIIPAITAGGPTAFCAGSSVTLTSSAETGYSWSNGVNEASINITTEGSYTVKVTNASGCQSAASVATIVTVNALPSASITKADNSGLANNDGIICIGTTATLTASGGTFYSWSSGETTAAIVKGTAGTYTVTVTDANGCTDTEAVNITVNALPIVTAGSNSPVCEGDKINLTSSGGGEYRWSGPNGFTSDNQSDKQNPSIHWANKANAGVYTVTVTASNGCAGKNTTSVIVNALPIFLIGSNNPVCEGNTINLTSSYGTGYSYSWSGPNGFISSLQSPSILNATTGMAGAYKVTVSTFTSCSVWKKTVVKINASPIATAGSNSPVCLGNTINLTSSGGTSYTWSGPNGFTSSIQNPSIPNSNTLMTGTYTVTVLAVNGCTGTGKTNVTFNEIPIILAGPDTLLKFIFKTEMKAKLSPSETGEWSLISGSGHFADIHSPTTRVTELSGGENIFLWKVRNGSCEASDEVIITVYDPFIPSVITPNGDGKNDYFKIRDIIDQDQVELIIFNRWGNEEFSNRNYSNDWDGRNNKGAELPNDTYFYILKFDNVNIKKGSVLIKR